MALLLAVKVRLASRGKEEMCFIRLMDTAWNAIVSTLVYRIETRFKPF